MLKTEIIHPGPLQALALAGHSAGILVADGNYGLVQKQVVHVQARRIGETAQFQQKICEFADSTPPGLVQLIFGQSLSAC